ncbi:MAG: energy-coupling factor transporter transmembrane component T [Actinomycetota bacterium]
MEKLKIPKVMILILSFMYRYIFVLVDEVMRMKRARDSRNFGGHKTWQIKTIGNMIGTLFMRTYERAERVYVAMVSRGFSGEIKTLDNLHLTVRDFCFLSLIILYLIFIRVWMVP